MSDVSSEDKRLVLEILEDHRGADNPITSREIASLIGKDEPGSFPETRAIIRALIKEDYVPIASTSNGYFIIKTREELEEYIEQLDRRINGMQERKVRIKDAFEQSTGEEVDEVDPEEIANVNDLI